MPSERLRISGINVEKRSHVNRPLIVSPSLLGNLPTIPALSEVSWANYLSKTILRRL